MVTQDAAILPKVNKMKMKKTKKKSKKKKLKGANNFDSESEADKLDLDQKVYPLSHYISDQDELVNQMFLTISGSKLEAMLPPVLKSTPLTELKRLCLHELRGMSKKRILCCINGEVMEGSSGSEDEEDDKEEAAAEDSTQNDTNTKGEKRKPGDDQTPESYLLKKIKVEPGLEDSTGSGEGKSVLELLELEMRARIIKTMLEKGDEGKKITEDAIAAVMQSAKQVTKEGADVTAGNSKEAANAKADSKDDSHREDSEREAEGEEESVKERSRGRRRSQGKEGDRRRRYRSTGDGKRTSSRSQRRGDGNNSGVASSGRSSKKPKGPSSSEKQVIKKKKLTRKEFEERMKRAKKNRTYRQRKSSEDEEKAEENVDKPEENSKEGNEEKTEDKPDAKTQDAPTEENSVQDKAGGEASEKEEGEIDSNEEEEGACSPTDISSASHYSSSSSYSRSWSRSYSRSPSRSPYRGRQRRSRRSRSRSKSRRRRRSYSQSYSRSRSPERKGRGEHKRQSYERKRSREPLRSSNKKDTKKPSPAEDRSPSREEDWGHKCDIEFVDSEEDFDDNPEATKKDAGGKKTVPLNRIERASISFSLQKKAVGIAQSVDLDDLPLKKKQMADDIEALAHPVKPSASEEIVISSDSEVELQGSTQGTKGKQKSSKELKTDSKEQTEEHPVTSTTDSRLEGTEKSVVSFITKNINSQVNQQKIAKEVVDSEMKTEVVVKRQQGEITEDTSALTTDTTFEISTKKGMETVDKSNSKAENHIRDFNSMDGKETTPVTSGDAPLIDEGVNRDISPDNKEENKSESSSLRQTDPAEALSDRSAVDLREGGGSTLCEETEQDDNARETRTLGIGDKKHLSETEITKDSSKKPKKRTGKEINFKNFTAIHSVEEDGQTEAEASISDEAKGHTYKEIGAESKGEDTYMDSGSEKKMEKNDSSVTSEQEKTDSKTVVTVFGDQNEEEFCKGTEQLRFSEEEKESEETTAEELGRKRIPVEPIRLETGLIRRRVQPSRKIEMIVPEKSWMKREKKKKEKTKDVLEMEGVGLLSSTLFKGACSSSLDREVEAETSQKTEPVETLENKEVPVHSGVSVAPVSDSENSQPLDDLVPQNLASPTPKQDTLPEASQSEDKSLRKTDHDTEIIGVIETSNHPSDNFDDMDLGGSSWSMRWLQSEKVQKVVTSSKMLSRVRKKIQKKEKATKVVMAEKVEETQKPAEPVVPVIGSIEEYERLFGTKVKKDEAAGIAGLASQGSLELGQASGNNAQTQDDIPEAKDKGNPVFGSDDDGEDSEEEALWSKIIKK